MNAKRMLVVSLIGVLLILSATSTFAGTTSSEGLTYPNYPLTGPGLQSCEPWAEPSANTVTQSGIPEGATVTARFAYANPYSGSPVYQPAVTYSNVTGGSLVIPVVYPMDTTTWPVYDTTTNERAIAVSVFIEIRALDGTTLKRVSKQWWVRCQPPLPPAQGCTPGYWKQEHHFDSWVGYSPQDDFNTVFGVNASFNPHSLLDALNANGGGENALARHATAGLLNAANPNVNYRFTSAQIIAGVQSAYATGDFEAFKDELDFANNAVCPLD